MKPKTKECTCEENAPYKITEIGDEITHRDKIISRQFQIPLTLRPMTLDCAPIVATNPASNYMELVCDVAG